jgi:PHD/YefM family antitoxin component YafN of YafNO toxin-antitoxin module
MAENVVTLLHLEVSMAITTLSSREFNHDRSRATKAADQGTVIVTRRKKPAYVFMTYEEYRKLSGHRGKTLYEALVQDAPEGDFEFEAPKLSDDWGLKIPDFDD